MQERARTISAEVKRSARAFLLTSAVLFIASCISSFGANPRGEEREALMTSLNYGEETFINPVETDNDLEWREFREIRRREKVDRNPPVDIPVTPPPPATYDKRHDADSVRVTWIGHATTLVELDGFRVLTDPIFGERCSPVRFAGPRRLHRPGIELEDLPEVDAVIISHDHYDHLDQESAKALAAKGVPFFVPLGVGAHLRRWGIEDVTELDWWQHAEVRNAKGEQLRLQATPARHFSGRGALAQDRTLWASWALLGPRHRVWFGGDTGYFDGFKEIGEKLGPFELTIVPVGAYDRAWKEIHVDPEEAIQAHIDVRGEVMLPIHWGTFNLGLHAWNEPIHRALESARARDVTLITPTPGQVVDTASPPPVSGWFNE